MNRFSRQYVLYAVLLVILLGAVAAAFASEQVRCAVGVPCANDAPLTAEEPAATPSPSVATTTPAATSTAPVPAQESEDTERLAAAPRPQPSPSASTPPPAAAPASPAPTAPAPAAPVVAAPPVTAEEGAATFVVSPVPLLVGGEARAGESVPLSYLQVVNRGPNAARLTGFWILQNGNAPAHAVIGLSTVDDKGGSRRQTGGVEGSTPFNNNAAFAPTSALFMPGQMRLFTIKGTLSSDISAYYGTELKIDVTGLEAEDVTFIGAFPLRGTTWTLSP